MQHVGKCDNGDVWVNLPTDVGLARTEIPQEEAVKFAVLLLKYAGCKVTINGGVITAVYRKVKVDLQ